MGRHITGGQARRAAGAREGRVLLRGGLLEILLVTAVLGLASAVAVVGVSGMSKRAVRTACDESVQATALAAHAYLAGHGSYPTEGEQLFAEGYLQRQTSTAYEVVYASNAPRPGFTVTGLTSRGDSCRIVSG